jgi:hypothetical protein
MGDANTAALALCGARECMLVARTRLLVASLCIGGARSYYPPPSPPPPPAVAHAQGDVNPDIVSPDEPVVMVNLEDADDTLRYFDIVEPGSRELFNERGTPLVLAARGGYGADDPADETWNMQLVEASAQSTLVVWDRGFAANGFMRKFGDEYLAFGGEYVDNNEGEWQEYDPRDGAHVLRSDSLQKVRDGEWYSPDHGFQRDGCCDWVPSPHQFALDGWHGGRRDARGGLDNVMMFDGKFSVVRHRGHWLLYARANLKQHGGRFAVVARSRTEAPWGDDAYEDFQLISISGYDYSGPGNVYFVAVDRHPFDDDMLVGLMPVNMGQPGEGNGDGESFIALSLSCDGLHWSRLTKLVWSVGRNGRTWDHPVDGLLLEEGGNVSFLVHRNVMDISPLAPEDSRILRYRLRTDAFHALSLQARQQLSSCSQPPVPPHPPPPLSPTPSPPPPPPPPPSFPRSSPPSPWPPPLQSPLFPPSPIPPPPSCPPPPSPRSPPPSPQTLLLQPPMPSPEQPPMRPVPSPSTPNAPPPALLTIASSNAAAPSALEHALEAVQPAPSKVFSRKAALGVVLVTLGGSAMLLGGCLLCKRSGPKRGRLADRARRRVGSKGKAMMRVDTTENGRAESQEAEMYELNAAAQEAWTGGAAGAGRSSSSTDEWDLWKDLRQAQTL